MTSLLKMMANAPRHPDFTEALEVYVAADKAREKAREAFERADSIAQQMEAHLRAVYDRVTGKQPEPDGAEAECGFCTTHITRIGGEWWADDGTLACTDTSAPYVPHKPAED